MLLNQSFTLSNQFNRAVEQQQTAKQNKKESSRADQNPEITLQEKKKEISISLKFFQKNIIVQAFNFTLIIAQTTQSLLFKKKQEQKNLVLFTKIILSDIKLIKKVSSKKIPFRLLGAIQDLFSFHYHFDCKIIINSKEGISCDQLLKKGQEHF
ncbi:hypothetical protein ABPG74_014793 [Tetrahymena malaccensis]